MSKRPLESLKQTANQLADLIYEESQDIEKIEALERELGIIDDSEDAGKSPEKASAAPKNGDGFGIWKPGLFRGQKCFVRDNSLVKEFSLWSSTHRIAGKGSKKRVVFMGESVARGFLYDPFFTPASHLGELLKNKSEAGGIEVIDLAKTNLQINELKDMCSSCLALEPDAVTIFAGNNWVNGIEFSKEDMQWILETMKKETAAEDLKRFLEEWNGKMVRDFIAHADAVFKAKGIPWVLIVPEFNLMDWKGLAHERTPVLPKGETPEWVALKEKALKAMEAGELDKAETVIQKMIELNGIARLPYELMAECKLNNNRESEARQYLWLAQDAKMYTLSTIPGIISVIQNTLAKEAKRAQIHVVDLRSEFSEYGIPGKELFIDYCHLTAKGIQLSMEAVAQKLLLILEQKDVSREALKAAGMPPSDDVKAKAHFFAAIHNAHNGQPFDNLYYHCKQALELSGNLKELFLNYIGMASRNAPWVLTKECEAIVSGGELMQYQALLQPYSQPIMDIELVNAMVAALKTKNIDMEAEVLKLRIDEHGIQRGKVNLLDSYYHRVSYRDFSVPTKGYYRAFDTESRFFLVVHEDGVNIELNLTGRVPLMKSGDNHIAVRINDSEPIQVTASGKWTNYALQLPENAVKKGINYIEIQWPRDIDIEKNWQKTAPLGLKIKNVLWPVYGEIHMLTASQID